MSRGGVIQFGIDISIAEKRHTHILERVIVTDKIDERMRDRHDLTEIEVVDERRELNQFLFREIRATRNDMQLMMAQMTALQTNQTCVVMPKLESLTISMESLDKKIRGNGKPGFEERFNHIERGLGRHETSLYDREIGVVPFCIERKISFKTTAWIVGGIGTISGTVIALLATPVGEWVARMITHHRVG